MVNFIIVLSVLCSSVAQIFLKKGMLSCQCNFSLDPSNIVPLVSTLAVNPFLLAGVSLHVVALFAWLYVLKHVDVSYAYPFIAMGFVIVITLGHFIFNEHINNMRVAGALLIVGGLFLIGRSAA